VATVPDFARALEPVDGAHRRAWFDAARRDYLEHRGGGRPARGPVDLAAVLTVLRRRLPEDAVIANGAGAFSIWCHRYTSFRRLGTQLAPTSGAMGYAVPAAIAAKLLHPGRDVVAITGDGDFQMAGQELATAVQEGADVVVVVVNNGMYGSIRMHQERDFPGRPYGTSLVNPDFAAYAEAFGAFGAVVSETGAFEEAFERALTAGRPALIELRVDPEGVTPTATLSEIRRNTIAP
jgi:acetolactate synthase-1/2/3 large subunit